MDFGFFAIIIFYPHMKSYYFDLGWPYIDLKPTWCWVTSVSKLMWHDKHDADNLDGTSRTKFQPLIMQVATLIIPPNVNQ